MEEWREVKGHDGDYMISNYGNVWSNKGLRGGKMLSQSLNKGYPKVSLCKHNVAKTRFVHQLVAEHFLGHTPDGYDKVVHHKDNNPLNRHVDNLEIISQRENLMTHYKGTSKYKGVHWAKANRKWRAVICIDYKNKHLGMFDNEEEAGAAYQKALVKYNLI